MSEKKIITVFGATGNQGGSVVDTFLNDPKLSDWSVRAVTRDVNKESAKALASKGAEVVSAENGDPASLEKAMQGSTAVFAMTNYWEKIDMKWEIQQGKNLADAAKSAGVEHFIWSSLLDINKLTNGKLPHMYHFDGKAQVEEYIRTLSIPATFFLPGFYLANVPGGLLRQNAGPEGPWTLAMPIAENTPQIPAFDTADTGKWIKAIVLHRDELLGERILASTAYYTPHQMLEEFKQTFPQETGKKGTNYYQLPGEAFKAILTGQGLPEFAAEELLENYCLFEQEGYYGGASLEKSLAWLGDDREKLTTWVKHMKKSPAFKDLK